MKKHERKWSCLIFEVFCSVCISGQAGNILIVFIKSVLHRMERMAAVGNAAASQPWVTRMAFMAKMFRIAP